MAQIPGSIPITGKVAPTDTTDTFATHVDVFGEGGYMTVADQAEREAITTERRKQGMAVFQNDTNEMYILQDGVANSNWTLFSGGSSVQSTKVTLTSTEILNLGSTFKEIIPNPGVGKFIQILSIYTLYNFKGTAYTGQNTDAIYIRYGVYGPGLSGYSTITLIPFPNVLSQSTDKFKEFFAGPIDWKDNSNVELWMFSGNTLANGNGEVTIYASYIIKNL